MLWAKVSVPGPAGNSKSCISAADKLRLPLFKNACKPSAKSSLAAQAINAASAVTGQLGCVGGTQQVLDPAIGYSGSGKPLHPVSVSTASAAAGRRGLRGQPQRFTGIKRVG